MKAAAAGDTEVSFSALENIGAIVEGAADDLHDSLVHAYLGFARQSQSALVVSQTRAEVRALNESIRAETIGSN